MARINEGHGLKGVLPPHSGSFSDPGIKTDWIQIT